MQTIILKQIRLLNFKGVRDQVFTFSPFQNVISGDNATGKTSILDAFLWCLFGKDSTDRKDFEVKTLDTSGSIIHRLDHEVEITLEVDYKEIVLKKILREKWQKKRGSNDTEFTGNETEYYWNDVPLKMAEYQGKIAQLIDEGLFKLLTNVTYFHTLKWEKRREIIFSLAGEISEQALLDEFAKSGDRTHVKIIQEVLNQDKSIEDAKKEVANKKRRIKDELVHIPARIDEAHRSMPAPVDVTAINKEIAAERSKITAANAELADIDQILTDKTKQLELANAAHNEKITKVYELKNVFLNRKREIEYQIRSNFNDPQAEIQGLKKSIDSANAELIRLEERIEKVMDNVKSFEAQREKKIAIWHEINSKSLSFDDQHFDCPACKRALDPADIEAKKAELTKNFNEDKTRRLAEITSEGQQIKSKLQDSKSLRDDLTGERDAKLQQLTELKDKAFHLQGANNNHASLQDEIDAAIKNDAELKNLSDQISDAEKAVSESTKADDSYISQYAELKFAQNTIIGTAQERIKALEIQLASQDAVKKVTDRISQLAEEESKLANELANLEGAEFAILQYEKSRVQFIEKRINDKFDLVTFKMFETQINGQEIPCCKTLINGVPFEDANSASKINAGLDIINALADYYDIEAPVFVDNSESINQLIPVHSQSILLKVSKDPALVFTSDHMAKAIR